MITRARFLAFSCCFCGQRVGRRIYRPPPEWRCARTERTAGNRRHRHVRRGFFVLGWNALGENRKQGMVVLAIAALCIALLDALHMMSVQGLFDINTPANLSRDRYLSLFARAVAAKSLLMIALLPFNSRVRRRAATAALTLAVVTVGVVASLIFFVMPTCCRRC
ncbi:MASE3 domain-containing protein [Undibacterium arcticum]